MTIVYVSRKKDAGRKKRKGEKKRTSDIFADLQRGTNGIKDQWRLSALLWGFLVVLLSEAFSFLFFPVVY